jgi:hypothetical protein
MQEVYKGWDVQDTWDQPFWNQMVGGTQRTATNLHAALTCKKGGSPAPMLRTGPLPAGLQLSSVSHGKPYSTVIDKTPDQWKREMDPYRMRDKVQEIAWPQEWRNVSRVNRQAAWMLCFARCAAHTQLTEQPAVLCYALLCCAV